MTEVSPRTTTRPAPWWRTATNPPCQSWCTDEHTGTEFQQAGALTCTREIAATDWYAVEVMQTTSVGDDASDRGRETDRLTIWQWCSRDVSECTINEVTDYATALMKAVAFIQGQQ